VKKSTGMRCDIKNLYQTKADEDGDRDWTENYPDYIEEPAENSETLCYALLVRNRKSSDSHKKLTIDSIVVQSPILKRILGKVLKDYPGITTGLGRLEFEAFRSPVGAARNGQTGRARPGSQDSSRSVMEYARTPIERHVRKEGRPCYTRCNNLQAHLDNI